MQHSGSRASTPTTIASFSSARRAKPPRGTIYIWAPVPEGFDSAAAYCEHVLEEAAVVVSPGGAYGPNGEGFFRISLTPPDDRLSEAVERLGTLAR